MYQIVSMLKSGLVLKRALTTGLILGLGMLTKVSFLLAFPLVLATMAFLFVKQRGRQPPPPAPLFDKPVFQASGELNFELAVADESAGETRFTPDRVIRQGRISISQIDSFDDGCRFTFEPVPGSGDREYALRLSFISTSDTTAPVFGEPAPMPGRNLYVDGRPVQGNLGMSFFHDAGIMGLLDRLRPFRPAGLSSPAFLLPIFLLGAGSFGWLLWQMAAESQPAARARTTEEGTGGQNLTIPDDSGKTGECL